MRFYKLLELERSASAADVRKAYRRLAVLHHPDKGGDAEKFKEISLAYEVLSDDEKRRVYDERGEAGVQGGGGDPTDIFEMFFGGGTGGGKRRTKDVVHPIDLTLEQLYTGVTKKLAVNRDVIDASEPVRDCGVCGGTGRGPAPAFQPMPVHCKACSGSGRSYKKERVREVMEIFIEKGAPHGHRIVFAGRADEQPDCETGDVVFIVHQKEHREFRRRGADLFLERKISLLDALVGFRMVFTHLDGRRIPVKTAVGDVVQPLAEGTGLKALTGEGMPTFGQPFVFGSLFLVLSVQFPEELSPEAIVKLRLALPAPTEPEVLEGDVVLCELEDMEPEAPAPEGEGPEEAHQQPMFGGPPPGCPQQ